jgi:hypothetical protein
MRILAALQRPRTIFHYLLPIETLWLLPIDTRSLTASAGTAPDSCLPEHTL